MTLLAKRYATALHRLAIDAGVVAPVSADVRFLNDQLASTQARALLTSPDVNESERAAVLQKLGSGRHALVQNLLGVLAHRRRLEVLFDLHPEFHALHLAQQGEVEGTVETTHPIDAAELEALTKMASRLSGKKVTLTVAIRPELLGGVRLRVGNVLYDGSMKAQLVQLEAQMLQASI
ncbi:MAG: ATP synthase F1 subunit delta [Planctomycetes bacterium]|nr:ATP synthase F1 subunit delta [Planctomycetota bacterium]